MLSTDEPEPRTLNPEPRTLKPIFLPAIPIVLLAVNVPTRSILSALKPDSFPSRDPAVGLCSCFQSPGSRLLSFQPSGFAPRKPAAPYALPDAPLLSTLAPIYAWRLLRGRTDPERNHKRDR